MQQIEDIFRPEGRGRDLLNVPVTPVSLVNDIAERFRQAVISGSLKPGDEINESQLAERLGVARGTLREALRILAGEGLIEKLPNRTSRVRKLSPEKIWEIMTARAVIESFGARVLAQRLTPDKVELLYSIWERLNAAAQANDRPEWVRWDFCLHQTIMELSGHQVLYETWTRMSAWVRLMFASEDHTHRDLLCNAASHKAIIEAIAGGDADLAEARLKADLLDQKELDRVVGLASVIAGTVPANHAAGSSEAFVADTDRERR
jgi:DNA-binding GntR family transcriptional regulator